MILRLEIQCVETDLINDKKGLEGLSGIICCVLWHGPVMEFILYYTPGIYAEGYIAFAFLFVCSFVRLFVCLFVRSLLSVTCVEFTS